MALPVVTVTDVEGVRDTDEKPVVGGGFGIGVSGRLLAGDAGTVTATNDDDKAGPLRLSTESTAVAEEAGRRERTTASWTPGALNAAGRAA